MATRYYKRYRMDFDLKKTDIPSTELPDGFEWVSWHPRLIEAHARIKAECFEGEIDSVLFPCLSHLAGCRKLMSDIASRSNFVPAATWLIRHANRLTSPAYCGTIQGMSRATRLGAIQNVGITPDCRGLGLGKSLVSKCLEGFAQAGMHRVYLDVTAANCNAVGLYEKIGFRIREVSFLTLNVPESESTTSLA
ncbi:GNAT family N-acetyltransferase [Rubinisphaera margarita]|uniref:GNAT family N-acetyltransferase n=1 Tax=Rubinisphaera margarita TaxID=2909586 RepID=UPI001EE7AB00|nr:GNAT family N-acetyltransferase [Rubinisphaera margarita]MCG6157678.1 GNAT family N-acetyltransferase [Rubinisphaera margarita]